MELKVNQEQIDRLYRFTREHYVEHYDLQTELVDHLSNAIEEEWKENPKLSFEEALQKEFKKFGVFGFSDVVEQRQSALAKRYHKFVWNNFKAFFKLPKIILTVGLMGILFQTLQVVSFKLAIVIALLIGFVIVYSYFVYQTSKKFKEKKKIDERRWIMEEMIFNYGTLTAYPILLNLFFQIVNFKSISFENSYVQLVFSIIFVSIGILFYVLTKIIPSKAEDYLKQTYPEYAFSK